MIEKHAFTGAQLIRDTLSCVGGLANTYDYPDPFALSTSQLVFFVGAIVCSQKLKEPFIWGQIVGVKTKHNSPLKCITSLSQAVTSAV